MHFRKLWFYYFTLGVFLYGMWSGDMKPNEGIIIAGILLMVYIVDISRGKFDNNMK